MRRLLLLAVVLGLLVSGCSLGPPMTVQQEQNIYKERFHKLLMEQLSRVPDAWHPVMGELVRDGNGFANFKPKPVKRCFQRFRMIRLGE
jgi:hypothetical protein